MWCDVKEEKDRQKKVAYRVWNSWRHYGQKSVLRSIQLFGCRHCLQLLWHRQMMLRFLLSLALMMPLWLQFQQPRSRCSGVSLYISSAADTDCRGMMPVGKLPASPVKIGSRPRLGVYIDNRQLWARTSGYGNCQCVLPCYLLCPARRKGALSVAFVRLFVRNGTTFFEILRHQQPLWVSTQTGIKRRSKILELELFHEQSILTIKQ